MWLAEAGEIRVLFDPLLTATHHGDVFELSPPRAIDEEALRPDFVVVTHRHPDHFDVPSLARLARRDPEAVVLTSDPLVERAARRLGFRRVARLEPLHRVDLAGATMVTTPSRVDFPEWGAALATPDGVVFNQVDTVLGGAEGAGAVVASIEAAIGRGIDLALVRWQPALEVSAQLAGRIGFPHRAYADLLDEIAAIDATAYAPTAAGVRHAEPYGWLNRSVYPVTETRFAADLRARTGRAVHRAPPGTVLELSGGALACHDGSPLVERGAAPMVEPFVPFAIPPLVDPNPAGRDPAALRLRIDRFVEEELAPALARNVAGPRRLVLEVVYPDDRDAYTMIVGPSGEVAIDRGFDADYDVVDAIAASYLVDVIEGRRHWGEPLLGGLLRASVRAYEVDARGLRVVEVAPIFLYYALSYDESHARWVDHQLALLA